MPRVRKLLMQEYADFKEKVLVESPFAQITEDGTGIRQVQLALTAKHIIIGEDIFDKYITENLLNVYYQGVDPENESMELIGIMPLTYLSLRVFRRKERKILKIIVGNYAKIMYFEFGGYMLRNLYWELWREKIALLKININKFSKITNYVNPYKKDGTPCTSNSENEMPKRMEVIAQVHASFSKNGKMQKPKIIGGQRKHSDLKDKLKNCIEHLLTTKQKSSTKKTQSETIFKKRLDGTEGGYENCAVISASDMMICPKWSSKW